MSLQQRERDGSTNSVSSDFSAEFHKDLEMADDELSQESADEEPECYAETISREDEKTSTRWKLLVLLLLSLNAVIIVIATYSFLIDQEAQKIESAFLPLADKVIESNKYHASNLETTFHVASGTLTIFVDSNDQSFPEVAMPHFDTWGGDIMEQSGVEFLGFAPLVGNGTVQKRQWERYAEENPWYNLTEGVRVAPKIFVLETYQNEQAIPQPQQGPGPYMPVWQVYPSKGKEQVIKYDLLSNPVFQRMFETLQENNQAVVSPVMNLNAFLGAGQHEQDQQVLPQSVYFEPVFDQLEEHASASQPSLRGVLFGVFAWEDHFNDILEGDKEKIYAVVENDCGQNFTYLIEGSKATYLGVGDHHAYTNEEGVEVDTIMVATEFGDIGHNTNHHSGEAVHNGTAVHEHHHCMYRLIIYPTNEFRNSFQSAVPLVVSVLVATMFFITLGAFLMYVTYIQNRQKRLLAVATHTSKIVSSLFPANVRERILKDAEDKAVEALTKGEEEAAAAEKASGKGKLRLRRSSVAMHDTSRRRSNTGTRGSREHSFLQEHLTKAATNMLHASTAPIADVFANTTVFFGDIVGFTAWSANRTPTAVFHLLETLYGAFDAMASKRKVYKIETVGDCYVAVTGVPEPNKDHALAMALFALDCISSLKEILSSVGETIGPETNSLNMRIGLHSGSVTGGVLRGERGRFQLFGDTMNTASRIEHGGMPGRIHLSQSTADELIHAGRRRWIVRREETIQAKGKGELQTYWLEPDGHILEAATTEDESFASQAS